MRFTKRLLLVLLLTAIPAVYAQNIEFQIDVVTHMNTPSEFWIDGNLMYSATSGGLLIQNLESGETEIYTAGEGIYGHNLAAMAQNRDSILVLGGINGNLAFLDLSSGNISNDQNLLGNEVVDLLAIEDTLWVLSKDFVSVYLFNNDQNRYQFRESYQEFGETVDEFRAIEYAHNRIWLASDIGLIHASANFLRINLYAGTNWSLITSADGLPDNSINDVIKDPATDDLYIATPRGLSRYDQSTFQQLTGVPYITLSFFDNEIYGATTRAVYRTNDSGTEILHDLPSSQRITNIAIDNSGEIWAGLLKRGLQNLSTNQRIVVDGPLDNYLGEMVIDNQGRLWTTSGIAKDERRQGVFVRTENGWQNYFFAGGTNAGFNRVNSTMAVYEDPAGYVWVGAWGGGIIIFDPGLEFVTINTIPDAGNVWISSTTRDDTLEVLTPTEYQNILSPITNNQYYSVVTDIIPDRNNDYIWIVNSAAGNNREILQYKGTAFSADAASPSTWQAYDLPFNNKEWFEITQDVFGDFWLVTGVPSLGVGIGQIRFQEDRFDVRGFNENDNLKTNATWSIAADEDGYVWVGTRSGLNAILSGTVFDFRETYQPIGLQINDVFVDSRNNKWFATNRGISILRASGSPFEPDSWVDLVPPNTSLDAEQLSLRANIFTGNLPSENIHNIYINDATGEIFLSTDAGLAILKNNPFASTFSDFEQLKVGPNPFYIGDAESNTFNFYNIVDGSEVKILTANGTLVRRLSPENSNEVVGGLAQWDGRNLDGRLVATGVYLYLIASENGQQKAGKVLVVRR